VLRDAGIDPDRLVDLTLEPGDVAFWHPCTVHGSGPNRGSDQRRFYLNSYVRAPDCDRGEWAFRAGKPVALSGDPVLVHYEALYTRPEPHYLDSIPPAD
jgi:ectoine hydroxylase-related dioxygenase (phytanoyl-CoA dioxygenase family)